MGKPIGFYRERSQRTGRMVTKPIMQNQELLRNRIRTQIVKLGKEPTPRWAAERLEKGPKVVVMGVDGVLWCGSPKGTVTEQDIRSLRDKGYEVILADPAIIRPEVREKLRHLGVAMWASKENALDTAEKAFKAKPIVVGDGFKPKPNLAGMGTHPVVVINQPPVTVAPAALHQPVQPPMPKEIGKMVMRSQETREKYAKRSRWLKRELNRPAPTGLG